MADFCRVTCPCPPRSLSTRGIIIMFRLGIHRTVWRRLGQEAEQSRWCHSTRLKHNIVVLDQCVTSFPPFNFDYTIKYHSSTRPDQLPSRIRDSTIVIASDTRVTREGILAAKNLKLVAINGTGTDTIDKPTLRELGVALCNVPAQNADAVAEHALALYYGLRRNLLGMHWLTMQGKAWESSQDTQSRRLRALGKPRTNGEETMVVFGYGALGMPPPTFS